MLNSSTGRRNIFKAAALLSIALVATGSAFAASVPVISSANVDVTANALDLSGANLLGPDGAGVFTVTVAGAAGSVQLSVLNASTTSISAGFPASSPASSLKPGTYTVLVRFYTLTPVSSTASMSYIQFAFVVPTASSTITPPTTPPISVNSTVLLFQGVSTISPVYSSIAITNPGPAIPSATSVVTAGTCTLSFNGKGTLPSQVTASILPGTVYTMDLISSTASGFTGYATAICNFKAQGVTYGAAMPGATPNFAIPAVVNP